MTEAKKEYKNLFPNGYDRMGLVGDGTLVAFAGEGLRAAWRKDGGFDLENSSISRSDGRIMGFGKLMPVKKFTDKSPDFKGTHTDPSDDDEEAVRYDIVGWWKTLRNGAKAGERYLSLMLTELPPKPAAA